MYKYFFILLSGLFFCQNCFAQEPDPQLYYTDYSGKKVDQRNAQYIIAIYPAVDTLGAKLYPVKEYFIDYNLKLVTLSATNECEKLIFEGSCMTFFRNGSEESCSIYMDGRIRGATTNYYQNRKLYSTEKYNKHGIHLLISCNDSTGNSLAANAEGEWIKYTGDRSKEVERGMIKDSLEEGEWHITLPAGDYTVVYHKGEIVSSTDPHNTGKEPVYAVVDTQARFSQKAGSYANFLMHNLKMPASARENNIQGKVVTTFVVEKDGTTSSFITVKSVSKDLDDECIRVLKLMPFVPAIKNGKPVRSYFTMPVNFSISNG